MPMPVQSQVGPQGPAAPGTSFQPRLGPTAELVESQMYGKYYEATRLGLVYTAANAVAGSALLTATSTTVSFALYNPPASGKRAILVKAAFGYVSGTMVAGCICYAVNTAAVNTVVAGGSALTINNNLQFGPASAMQAFGTATVSAAGTLLRAARVSQVVQAATATNTPWAWDEDLDGSIVLPPGGALMVGGNIALTAVVCVAVTWIEISHVVGA